MFFFFLKTFLGPNRFECSQLFPWEPLSRATALPHPHLSAQPIWLWYTAGPARCLLFEQPLLHSLTSLNMKRKMNAAGVTITGWMTLASEICGSMLWQHFFLFNHWGWRTAVLLTAKGETKTGCPNVSLSHFGCLYTDVSWMRSWPYNVKRCKTTK